MAGVIDRNIRALIDRRAQQKRQRRISDRMADAITCFVGSMPFVYLHLILFGAWLTINAGWVSIPGVPRFDPSFVMLAMVASVEALFLSTFVLITQNRMQAQADQRADLDLQVSLLAEHEVTRLVELVTQIARRMSIEQSHDPELAELQQDVQPERVLDRIEQQQQEHQQ
jgi:uncharacterized membrane protein